MAVKSKTSQPSSAAHTSRWSSSKTSTSLRRGQFELIQGISRLQTLSVKTQVFRGVSLFSCRLKYSIFLGCTIKDLQQSLLANMFPQNENIRLTKCSADEISAVISYPSLVFKFLKLIVIPEINGKQWLSGMYKNNLTACGKWLAVVQIT